MNCKENVEVESVLNWSLASEAEFRAMAAALAVSWRDQRPTTLVVGLQGPLGAGKTTWVRGMLEGLGHRGRVPSPTYTLLEYYELGELTVVHLDLYRLSEAPADFEALGVRDWLSRDGTWLLVEWPDRSPQLERRCDLRIDFGFLGAEVRGVSLVAQSAVGEEVLRRLQSSSSFNSSFGS